jgi:ribose transport system ATP-binding protein
VSVTIQLRTPHGLGEGDRLLSMTGVTKVFPNGTAALRGVDLAVDRGSVHALVGANGAGKSTLIKILAGSLPPTDGVMAWEGETVRWRAPIEAQQAGVATIYQHVPLAPTLSVLENVFLPRRGWQRRPAGLRAELDALVDRIGYALDPDALVEDLPIGQRQMVAICQALAADAKLVVMDEPTASLAQGERQVVFEVVRRISATGTSVVYVSHFLDEILDLSDAITVLRDGRVVHGGRTADMDEAQLVKVIVGRALAATESRPTPRPEREAPVVLEARDLRSPAGLHGVSLQVRAGEIVGIAGLLGSGRSELMHAIYGADPRARGTVLCDGHPVPRSPAAAVRAGMALVPEDRAAQGLFPEFEIWRNISMTSLPELSAARGTLPQPGRERRRAIEAMAELGIKAEGPDARVSELSGGNAQKVVFAKWLYSGARVFLLDEPTAGIDVGAKADIVEVVRRLAREGAAVLVVDSEFEELLALCSRVLVMRRGRIVAERRADQTNDHELVRLASGRHEKEIVDA